MPNPSQRAKYTEQLLEHGPSPRALLWNDYPSATSRYQELASIFDFSGHHVLDVGCGFGDILPYLLSHNRQIHYTGLDIVPEFITEAQRRYPGHTFAVGDYLQEAYRFPADIIICNGAFNYQGPEPQTFRQTVIERMFQSAQVGLAFTMAGHHPRPKTKKDSSIYYADSLEILKFCLTLSPKVIFKQHYHPREFMIGLLK